MTKALHKGAPLTYPSTVPASVSGGARIHNATAATATSNLAVSAGARARARAPPRPLPTLPTPAPLGEEGGVASETPLTLPGAGTGAGHRTATGLRVLL